MNWVEDLGMNKPKARFRFIRPMPMAEPGLKDRYAPYHGPRVCRSRGGRWRPKHEFVAGRCLWCDKEEN